MDKDLAGLLFDPVSVNVKSRSGYVIKFGFVPELWVQSCRGMLNYL